MELYKQISDANRIKYGTEAEKILRIIINQYSDRTHFIYEILQNAEDAGATRIQFHLEKEKLVIKHDGRPFNEKDIEGVCGIANGTKEDGTRIGHFGIGFKSVYCYTEHPYIYYQKAESCMFHRKRSLDYLVLPLEITDSELQNDIRRKHNIKLIKAVGELIWFAFQWMKNHQYLSISGFNTVFPVYEYEADDVLYGIYQNSIDMIREEALLPTNVPGEFKKIQEICVPLWGIIVDTFDDNDLRALRRKRNISWLAKEFSTEAYHDVRAFLNQNFKLETLEWKDLVLNMDAFFLSQKQLSWMEALMSRIESYCIKRATYDSHYIDVSQIPFVRTVSQEQICARDEHGKLQVYLNNPDIAKYRIESTFIKNESIRSFYRRALEIPEYNIEQETIENILPKYESANVKFKTKDPITENIDDLKVIKDAIYTNTSILERIKDKYIVTDGKNWYRPEEMYLRSNDTRSGYALVKGIVRIKYLADTYFDGTIRSLKLDEDFFKKIGCNAGIRMIPASRDEYLRAIRKYCGAKAESDYRTNIFFKTYISKKLDWSFNYGVVLKICPQCNRIYLEESGKEYIHEALTKRNIAHTFYSLETSNQYLRSQIKAYEIADQDKIYIPEIWTEDNPLCPVHEEALFEIPCIKKYKDRKVEFTGYFCDKCNKILMRSSSVAELEDNCALNGVPVIETESFVKKRPKKQLIKMREIKSDYIVENGKREIYTYSHA